MNNQVRESLRITSSALRYEEISNFPYNVYDNFEPGTDPTYKGYPFKGIHVDPGANLTVTIVGVDSEEMEVTLAPGCWSYGGIGLKSPSISSVKVLF